jgi:hypothetical protein
MKQIIESLNDFINEGKSIEDIKNSISGADKISKLRNGNYKAYFGFFYTHGQTPEQKVKIVKNAYPDAIIVDSGENWVGFKGGAPVDKQSHFYVEFTLNK